MTEGGFFDMVGLIDSGAPFTVVPLGVAAELGIEEQLEEDEAIEVAGASTDAWTFPGDITARVRIEDEDWGSAFPLYPVFADIDVFLLGRADFFAAFIVTFNETVEPTYLQIAEP